MTKEYITKLVKYIIIYCVAVLYVVTAIAISNYINGGCVPRHLSALETLIK